MGFSHVRAVLTGGPDGGGLELPAGSRNVGALAVRLVLVSLALHASSDGAESWPAVETIAREVGIAPQTTRYALRELEAAGLIEPVGGRSRGGAGRTTRYRLHLPEPLGTPAGSPPTEPLGTPAGSPADEPLGDPASTPRGSGLTPRGSGLTPRGSGRTSRDPRDEWSEGTEESANADGTPLEQLARRVTNPPMPKRLRELEELLAELDGQYGRTAVERAVVDELARHAGPYAYPSTLRPRLESLAGRHRAAQRGGPTCSECGGGGHVLDDADIARPCPNCNTETP